MNTTAIEEVLKLAEAPNPDRLERKLSDQREMAIRAFKNAQHELSLLVEQLEDDEFWISHGRHFVNHAGYSNSVMTYTADGLAHLAKAIGMVEGAL